MRPDVTYLGVPLAEMCNETFKGVRERILMKNIAYAGALAALLDIDTRGHPRAAQGEVRARSRRCVDSNEKAIELGYDYAKAHFDCPLPIRLEPMDATKDAILIDGNTAAALGCLYAGATVGAWYPITPATSLMDAFKGFCQKYRARSRDQPQNRFAILQAEDELAAIGMVIGASWAGARAFTPTAGPGHLADERVHRPRVLRRSARGDLRRAAHRAVDRHADAHAAGRPDDVRLRVARRHPAHLPVSRAIPREAFEFAVEGVRPRRALPDAGVRADRPRHRHERLDDARSSKWDDAYRPDRGKVLSAEELDEVKSFYRYLDADGDGIPYRTLPGVHPEGRVLHARLGPQPVRRLHRGRRRVRRGASTASIARFSAPRAPCRSRSSRNAAGATVGLVTVGGCHAACVEALDLLAKEGIALDYMRVRGFPFGDEVAAVPRVARGQLRRRAEPRRAAAQPADARDRRARSRSCESVRYYGGFPLSAHHVIAGVKAKLEKAA